jgi:hypothetical protein
MTATMEKPATLAPAASQATPAPAPQLTGSQQLLRAVLPKSFISPSDRKKAAELLDQHDKLVARYQDAARFPERRLAQRFQADPNTTRSLGDERQEFDAENRLLYQECNRIAILATALNAEWAEMACPVVSRRIADRIAIEKPEFEELGLAYQESPLIGDLRKLMAMLARESSTKTTTADISGSPRSILRSFLDL